ncbi:hypothetical protein BaRGS_00019477 [Batillaria attramentaria]|uniref:Ionotropic glutamate receptor C-terminal domain-containing protein n=1 Tax=Batillaria attramentaria TaxID=370345 RepID=A0ABD0KPP7_9CAEN
MRHVLDDSQLSYTFLDPPDDSWGQMLENGQWDGPIGMLARKEADLAVSAFVLTPGRSSVADPTTPYTVVSTVIVFKIPRERPEYFLQPFQTPVYVAIGGGFLAVLCLLLLLGTFRREPAGDGEISSEALSSTTTTPDLGEGLVWVWMMFGVVLSSVYSSKLTATLAVGDQVLPFTTLAQLVNQDTFTWGVMSGTAEASILKNSTDKDFKAFYQSAVRFSHTDPSVFSPDEEGVQKSKVKTGNYAYFSPFENLYEKWSSEICDLAKIPERYLTLPWVFYLQKGSPYTKLMSERITSMVDTGLVDHWIRQWFPESSPEHCSSPSNGQSNTRTTALTVRETQTAFYMAALGVGLAALTLGTELFIARLKVFLQFLLHRRRF